MSKYLKSLGALYFASAIALFIFIEYYLAVPVLSAASKELQGFAITAGGFAIVLGFTEMARLHLTRIRKKTAKEWPFSICLLVALGVITILGLVLTPRHWIYQTLFGNVYTPLDSAMYALTGFYIISATFRAFRIRSMDMLIFMIPAMLILMYNGPIFAAVWEGFGPLGAWLVDVANTAALRAYRITAAVGAVVFTVRVILGIERRWLG